MNNVTDSKEKQEKTTEVPFFPELDEVPFTKPDDEVPFVLPDDDEVPFEKDQDYDAIFDRYRSQDQALSRTIAVKTLYVDMTGDLIAGIMLGQIMYWYGNDENGRPRTRIKKKGRECIAKQRTDWYDEIRITPRQVDRSIAILRKKRLISTRNYRFNGLRTMHLFLNKKTFLNLMNKELAAFQENPVLTKGEDRSLRKVKTEVDKRGRPLTEITTEIVSKNTSVSVVPEKKPFVHPLMKPLLNLSRQNAIFANINENDWIDILKTADKSTNKIEDVLNYVDFQINRGHPLERVGGYIRACLKNDWDIDFENSDPWHAWGLEHAYTQ